MLCFYSEEQNFKLQEIVFSSKSDISSLTKVFTSTVTTSKSKVRLFKHLNVICHVMYVEE